ncbi:SRPBCC family protein [Kitasatospora aureofaciens]|uniref:SRPBCC family protein n=1 Tax=Kitasatospora aureofaciens TaxID=1894 RepID=UPI001C4435FF|nr:SRPBCC family protein [Kitasatospora aureofaciens]MBV6696722.1 SRPBCC family protein [Kitasatospora aureofaciens]
MTEHGHTEHGHTESSTVVAAPFDLVWEMTNDVAGWPQLFTEYADAEILEQQGDTVRFRLTMHPDDQGVVRSWVSERTSDRTTRSVRARRVETGPFEYMNIFWDYREIPEGVLMRWVQDFHVRAELPFGDEEMAAHLKANTVVQMQAVKERIEDAARN